jgi:hypothetical protein
MFIENKQKLKKNVPNNWHGPRVCYSCTHTNGVYRKITN